MPFQVASRLILLAALPAAAATDVTFHRDILPVLQKRCQSCHRPGEAAPIPFLTYNQVRPWAKAIKEAVLTKKMPPWPADPSVGRFKNDRTLSKVEVETLAAWADSGAVEGDPKHAPKPLEFVEGWTIGKPDLVLGMAEPFEVPATGVIDYQWVIMPTGFTEDKWIQAIEFRPGERSIVHHIAGFLRRKGSNFLFGAKPWIPLSQPKGFIEGGRSDGFLGDYVPGITGTILPEGMALQLPAGADILFQIHYTPNGKPARDRSRFGIIFAKEPPKYHVRDLILNNGRFLIPPRDPSFRVETQVTFDLDVRLLALNPHMHLRGKSMEVRAAYPDGRVEPLLRVPKYDFNWQITYELPDEFLLPAGTRLEATAHFD
ncbi:MAG: c-type cytochrome, partial [Bryobacteraceae bacterium]